jgi:hypothetical protein
VAIPCASLAFRNVNINPITVPTVTAKLPIDVINAVIEFAIVSGVAVALVICKRICSNPINILFSDYWQLFYVFLPFCIQDVDKYSLLMQGFMAYANA